MAEKWQSTQQFIATYDSVIDSNEEPNKKLTLMTRFESVSRCLVIGSVSVSQQVLSAEKYNQTFMQMKDKKTNS